MKKNLTLFLFCLFSCHLFSQTLPGQWAWIAGDSAAQQPAVYGTRGVADPANKPFARSGGISWRDAAGDTWIFGGSYFTSTGTLQYSFTDHNPLSGKNLYRLQQMDQDGKAVTSPTAQVDFLVAAQAVELLGNPVRSILGLRVQLGTQQSIQVEVRDLQGHLLQKAGRTGLAGSNDLSLPVGNLAKGTYVVRINLIGESITKQFVKL